MTRHRLWSLSLLLASACASSLHGQGSVWSDGFNEPGTDGPVYATAVLNTAGGSNLYVAGAFTSAGGVPVNYIAQWDGSRWSALGSGLNGPVSALAVFDDGGGPALYAGGSFTRAGDVAVSSIAKWNGTSWLALGSGLGGTGATSVSALAVSGSGTGSTLIAGGNFLIAGGVPAGYIAQWNGTAWSALGDGLNAAVRALTIYDSGSGPALIAGGDFTASGRMPFSYIAQWDGMSWSALGSGLGGAASTSVKALSVNGSMLVAGGSFGSAGGVAANAIAQWDGANWSALGSGMAGDPGTVPFVSALSLYDDGTGSVLVAGGNFKTAGGVAAPAIARWDGAGWSALAGAAGGFANPPVVYTLTSWNSASGPSLIAGGWNDTPAGIQITALAVPNSVVQWYGNYWWTLGQGLNDHVVTLAVYDDGNGPALYAGGAFTSAGGVSANYIAKWNGTNWSALGVGTNNDVDALAVFDDGGGPALYAGGAFTTAGGITVNGIAKWNGTNWSALSTGINMNGVIHALAVLNDGTGPALYAGGFFTTAGGVSANYIAKWDGTNWSALGVGLNSTVNSLTVFDDGTGPALYVGGFFTMAGGISAKYIAKWNGTNWSAALGSGVSLFVRALTACDQTCPPALQGLYAGGDFTTAGGLSANHVAKWDGTNWSALGAGLNGSVVALTVFDVSGGPALYAGGVFTAAGGLTVNYIAKWDGTNWSALGQGMNGGVDALTVFDDGGGATLYGSGTFTKADNKPSARIAKLRRN